MSEKNCPTCGRNWSYMQSVCPVCGANLGDLAAYETRPQRRATSIGIADLALAWLWMLVLTVVALLFGGAGLLALIGLDSDPPIQEPSRVLGWLLLIGSVILFGMAALNLSETLNRKEEQK